MTEIIRLLSRFITGNRVWKSVFRAESPVTERGQSESIFHNVWLHIYPVKVRKDALRFTYTFCLGGVSFLLFLLLIITGVPLMFYYVPSVEQAYGSMKDLEFVVSYGLLLRNMHRWAAHAMVITVFLHMARVFYTGSYKSPREFNWVVGVFLLALTLGLSFTGYLLPWDQLAFWAITVGTSIASYVPWLGPSFKYVLIGGNEVGQGALLRFYVLHTVVLPLAAVLMMAAHFWRIRKDGGISKPL
ncbi:MAG: selenite/tellurite reduction operon b-type cytochrome ExtP [Armatimonadota bacterium]|nr:selenite/tellurite reduction operon b-type cytochrome ExtP [Armatimonadota bacterium]